MATDILTLARETLALADGAADGPWGASYDPDDGEVWDDNGKLVCRVGKHPIGANCAFIAHSRTAAPELARFVEMVEEVTRGGFLRRQDAFGRGWNQAFAEIRRRLGLDTTEGGPAALRARKETDR